MFHIKKKNELFYIFIKEKTFNIKLTIFAYLTRSLSLFCITYRVETMQGHRLRKNIILLITYGNYSYIFVRASTHGTRSRLSISRNTDSVPKDGRKRRGQFVPDRVSSDTVTIRGSVTFYDFADPAYRSRWASRGLPTKTVVTITSCRSRASKNKTPDRHATSTGW